MAGVLARRKADAERDVALAHTTASFTRAKKLGPLEGYLHPAEPRRGSSRKPASLLQRLRTIARRTGGTVAE
jgi:hypothetical protein